jgi:alkanesulfonate monooxygenase SsuD/methylene tetrahydromethanopterin reductase-like flavin-dependent oxidoreductase (luciferase family)
VGTPEQIVDQLLMLSRNGLDGTALSFVNYQEELPQFIHDMPVVHNLLAYVNGRAIEI